MKRKSNGKPKEKVERVLTSEERRFAVWQSIFEYHKLGYSSAEIADVVKQSVSVIEDVLHGQALNRIRRIKVK